MLRITRLVLIGSVASYAACWAQPGGACRLGHELFAKRQFAEAQELLWQCVAAGAPTRDAAYELALTYRDLKNYASGWARAKPALGEHPNSVDLLYIAGFLKFRMGENDASLGLLDRAFRLDSLDWRVHQAFALNYVVLKIMPGVIAELQRAIELNSNNPELYYQLARAYYSDQMRVAESIAASEKALALSPEYAEVYSNLALCYEARAENDKARQAYERAVALTAKHGSRDEWPYMNYGAFLVKQGEAEPALPLLREALSRNPANIEAHYYLGRALRKLGRSEEAKQHLEQAIRLDPNAPGSYYELGTLLYQQGDHERGKELLDRYKRLKDRERPRAPGVREGAR